MNKFTQTSFFRKHGILLVAITAIVVWTILTWLVAARRTTAILTEKLRADYENEYTERVQTFEATWIAEHTPSADEEYEKQLQAEADCLAQLIGKMSTVQQKKTEIWNVFARVDNPLYPDTVEEVVKQPAQWMFYSESNPKKDDDVELARQELIKWHEGRYPAGFDNSLVYGTWTPNDYYLFDDWSKGFGTKVWRYGE